MLQCESPTRGCLDIEATNFAFSADKPCEDGCCTYPNLVLVFNQEFDGQVWRPDSVYTNSLGQLFVIKSTSFYYSNFELEQQGQRFRITDSLDLKTLNGLDTATVSFLDDVVLCRRIPIEYSVGTFKKSGFFDLFRCSLGLNSRENTIVSSKTPSGHPLNKQADSLWLSNAEGFVWMQMIMKKDTASATPLDTLRFTASDFGGQPFLIEKSGVFEHQTGTNFKINMTLNYAEMFKGINLVNIGQSDLKTKIISNLSTTFAVE